MAPATLRDHLVRRLRRPAGAIAERLRDFSEDHAAVPDVVTDATEEIAERVDDAADRPDRSSAQWVTTGVSALMIALLAGTILYEGYAGPGVKPAEIEVEVTAARAEQRGEHYYIPYTVRNIGDETVEEVTIGVEARDGEELIQEIETVIAALGEGEEVSGMLVFDQDPAGLTIDAAVLAFEIAEE